MEKYVGCQTPSRDSSQMASRVHLRGDECTCHRCCLCRSQLHHQVSFAPFPMRHASTKKRDSSWMSIAVLMCAYFLATSQGIRCRAQGHSFGRSSFTLPWCCHSCLHLRYRLSRILPRYGRSPHLDPLLHFSRHLDSLDSSRNWEASPKDHRWNGVIVMEH